MTVKSLNHKELTKMSSESMKKKEASDTGTLHFARFGRGGWESWRLSTPEGKENGLSLQVLTGAKKGKMAAWGAGPSLRSGQWATTERTNSSPTPKFCNKGCSLVWGKNVGSGLWWPGFEFCIYHYQWSLGQIISLLWVSIFLRYKMRIIIVLLERGMKIQWDGACFVCYQVPECTFTGIIIKFRQYYTLVKELIPVILKPCHWMNMRNGVGGR